MNNDDFAKQIIALVGNEYTALSEFDIVNIGLHFFHKDVRLMLPLVVKHSIVAA